MLPSLAAAQSAACHCQYREYAKSPTPAVLRLFKAAEAADTTEFLAALAAVPDPDAYAVAERPLLLAILTPAPTGTGREVTSEIPRRVLDAYRDAHRASWPARDRMLEAALARKVDPNAFTMRSGRPPLVAAAVFGSLRAVRLLLAAGADPNTEDFLRDNQNAVEFALDHEYPFRFGYPEFLTRTERTAIIRALFRAGTRAPWGGTRFRVPARSPWALLAALTEGDSVAIEAIQAGLPVTQLDFNGIPPITAAAQFGNADVVRVLRDRGPRSMRLIGDSVRFSAAAPRDSNDVDLWLDALIASAADTTLRVANLLLTRGMRWAQTGPLGVVDNVPEHHMGIYGRRDDGEARGAAAMVAPARAGTGGGDATVVHAAAAADNVVLLERLQTVGAPLDDTTQYGATPLRDAVRSSAVHAVQWLVTHGARVISPQRSSSPLDAVFDGLSYTDDRDRSGARQMAAVMLQALTPAALADSAASVVLVENVLRWTPALLPELVRLQRAGWIMPRLPARLVTDAILSRDTLPQSLAWLLAQPVDVNPARDAMGVLQTSPLLMALQLGADSVVTRLLAMGADPRVEDRRGMSPYLYALSVGDTATARLLRGTRAEREMAARARRFAAAVSAGVPAQIDRVLAEGRDPLTPLPAWMDTRALITESGLLERSLQQGLPLTVRIEDLADTSEVSLIEFVVVGAIEALADSGSRTLSAGADSLLAVRIQALQRRGARVMPADGGRQAGRPRRRSDVTVLALAMVLDAPKTAVALFDAGARPAAATAAAIWTHVACGGPRFAALRSRFASAGLQRAPVTPQRCAQLRLER